MTRVFPIQDYKIKLNNLKKKILSTIDKNLDDYQVYKIKNGDEFDLIIVKKKSIHENVLKSVLPVNKPIHL